MINMLVVQLTPHICVSEYFTVPFHCITVASFRFIDIATVTSWGCFQIRICGNCFQNPSVLPPLPLFHAICLYDPVLF